jgi:hypothetical protein
VAAAEVKTDSPGYLNEGRLPDQQIPGSCIVISPSSGSAEQLAKGLLHQRPAVAVALRDNQLIIALQSVLPRQDEQIVAAFQAISRGESSV